MDSNSNPPLPIQGTTPLSSQSIGVNTHSLSRENDMSPIISESDWDIESGEEDLTTSRQNTSYIPYAMSDCETVQFCNKYDRFTSRHGLRCQPHHFVTYHFPDFSLLDEARDEKLAITRPHLHARRFDPGPVPSQPGQYEHFSVIPTELGDKALRHLVEGCTSCAEQSIPGSYTESPLSNTFRRMLNLTKQLPRDKTESFWEAMTRVSTFQGVSKVSMIGYRRPGKLGIRLRRCTTFTATGEETDEYDFSMEEWEQLSDLLRADIETDFDGQWGSGMHFGYILCELLSRSTNRAYWSAEAYMRQQGYMLPPDSRLKWYTYTPPDELSIVAPDSMVTSRNEHDRACCMCLEPFDSPFLEPIPEDALSEPDEQMALELVPDEPDNSHGEIPVRLPCGHIFGKNCISLWCAEKAARPTCPTCRSPIFTGIIPCPSLKHWLPEAWQKLHRYKTQGLDKGWPSEHDQVCPALSSNCRPIESGVDSTFSYDYAVAVHHLDHLDSLLRKTLPSHMRRTSVIVRDYQQSHPQENLDFALQTQRLEQLKPPLILTDPGRSWSIAYSPEWQICYPRLRAVLTLLSPSVRCHPRCMFLYFRGHMACALWDHAKPEQDGHLGTSLKSMPFPETRPGFLEHLDDILMELVEFLRRSSVVGDDLLQAIWHDGY